MKLRFQVEFYIINMLKMVNIQSSWGDKPVNQWFNWWLSGRCQQPSVNVSKPKMVLRSSYDKYFQTDFRIGVPLAVYWIRRVIIPSGSPELFNNVWFIVELLCRTLFIVWGTLVIGVQDVSVVVSNPVFRWQAVILTQQWSDVWRTSQHFEGLGFDPKRCH